MTTTVSYFPPSFAAVVSRLPVLPPSFVFTRVMNLVLGRKLMGGDLSSLHGKHFSICVTDTGLRLYFTVGHRGFVPMRAVPRPDLAISATAHDFYLLATRREDPDALFFSRRLVVEGDTELGLIAKNTLDGIELPAFGNFIPMPSRILAAAKNAFLHP